MTDQERTPRRSGTRGPANAAVRPCGNGHDRWRQLSAAGLPLAALCLPEVAVGSDKRAGSVASGGTVTRCAGRRNRGLVKRLVLVFAKSVSGSTVADWLSDFTGS